MALSGYEAGLTSGSTSEHSHLTNPAGKRNLNRAMLGTGAMLLLLINLGVGLFAREQQRTIIARAIETYDTAFVSSHYIHRAQISFQRFIDDRNRARTSDEISSANEQLSKLLDELDVVIERSPSSRATAEGTALRAQIAAIPQIRDEGDELTMRLTAIQDALERLDKRTSAIGLHARDEIEELSTKNDYVLLGSIITSVMLAGLTLALLRHAVARSTFARISHMASYDALTGLPNRTMVRARLNQVFENLQGRDGGFALLSLDLDRFKNVNDTLGHHTGDLLLAEVAGRIRETVRNTDMVARLGGDEFVILVTPALEPLELGALAERVVATISKPYIINAQQILIGASVGIAIAPQDGANGEDLLRHSDVALYQAKTDGKGRFRYFTPEMNVLIQSRRMMEISLREAIERRELAVYFQPLMDVSSGRINACEALVRWMHPTNGPISPAEFIPLAEETGLIVAIGEHVLRTACAEAASWSNGLAVAVNLSAVQFRSCDLSALVARILAETGLEPHRLELEITESILIEDKDRVMQMLTSLRGLGVRIALDDFGTGYSSLSYLSSFPFDKIKIDRTFVRNLTDRQDSAAIVSAILSLAETLRMSTTAEGVEKMEQLDWLRAHGCDQAQGFLFSAAVPAHDLRLLLGMKPESLPGTSKTSVRAA